MGTRREIDGEKSMKRKERDGDGKERERRECVCMCEKKGERECTRVEQCRVKIEQIDHILVDYR